MLFRSETRNILPFWNQVKARRVKSIVKTSSAATDKYLISKNTIRHLILIVEKSPTTEQFVGVATNHASKSCTKFSSLYQKRSADNSNFEFHNREILTKRKIRRHVFSIRPEKQFLQALHFSPQQIPFLRCSPLLPNHRANNSINFTEIAKTYGSRNSISQKLEAHFKR